MKMANNPVIYEVSKKQYLRSILDTSDLFGPCSSSRKVQHLLVEQTIGYRIKTMPIALTTIELLWLIKLVAYESCDNLFKGISSLN